MYNSVLQFIEDSRKSNTKLLAILLDPDKVEIKNSSSICSKIESLNANFIFVGGSYVANNKTELLVAALKKHTKLPIVLFPGDFSQVTNKADALLFLSLLSGRNPEYLIEQQIKAVPYLKNSPIEIIPTGYILIDGGTNSSVLKVSKTEPIAQNNIELAVNTAVAGMYKGKKLIYLEAGSGAKHPVNTKLIAAVKESISIPLIVGGGIRTKAHLDEAYNNGADLVVIGTAFETNNNLSIN